MENNDTLNEERENFSFLLEVVKDNYRDMLSPIISSYVDEDKLEIQLEELIEHICQEFHDGHYKGEISFSEWIFCVAHNYMMNKYPVAHNLYNEQIPRDISATELIKKVAPLPRFQIICRMLKQKLEQEGRWTEQQDQ